MFRGVVPACASIAPYMGIQFATYEGVQRALTEVIVCKVQRKSHCVPRRFLIPPFPTPQWRVFVQGSWERYAEWTPRSLTLECRPRRFPWISSRSVYKCKALTMDR